MEAARQEGAAGAETKKKLCFRSVEEKRRIVEQTLAPGASVTEVARAHGVNRDQVFVWRRLYGQGLLENRPTRRARLLPVRVVGTATRKDGGVRGTRVPQPSGDMLQIEFPNGHLRIAGRVDAEALRVVLEKLLG